jgi:hypothetical protein
MVKPTAAQPSRSASATLPVTAWFLAAVSVLALLSLRMVGSAPAKLSAPASIIPSGAA